MQKASTACSSYNKVCLGFSYDNHYLDYVYYEYLFSILRLESIYDKLIESIASKNASDSGRQIIE